MKNILVPLGTASIAGSILQYAVDFAAVFSANIYVMEVFNVSAKTGNLSNISDKIAANTKAHLKEVIKEVDAKGVLIKIVTYNGDVVDGLKKIDRDLGIDLMVLSPRSNDVSEKVYLGNVSGRICKQTNIPALIVPRNSSFTPYKSILTAFKSGIVKRNRKLKPLVEVVDKFEPKVNMLLVKTPGYTDEDLQVNPALMDISSQLTITENQTTYLGVLEHFLTKKPDLLVVFRRKRGFFKKLWEKNTILKSEFSAPIPVLVLSVKKD